MPYYKASPLRGSLFEELINKTNQAYMDDGLAVIQKIPTSIKPVELDSERGVITLAYFDQKSTVDYVGNVQGIPVCFDAKETKRPNLPISNIQEHQMQFMEKYEAQNGIAFILVYFSIIDKIYLLDIRTLGRFYRLSKEERGRKSIPLESFDPAFEVPRQGRYLVHYLEAIDRLLCEQGRKT
ncbi:MAG: Holliday junction resolvase RecU [Eubacteriaceae bacterium]|jgi:recombination protein U|nr:Holliday junction resolvase RecU [Eubacteriaceae bacterium]